MRVAVISDIHGNAVALEVVINDLQRRAVDQVVCLGDAIQGGPQPAEVVAQLRALGCPVVMGNADDWLLTGKDSGREQIVDERRRRMDAVRAWSLEQLSDADRAFIAEFQPTIDIPLPNGRRLLCFHGSPSSYDDVILPTTPENEFQLYLLAHVPALMTGGHTHMQQIRRIAATESFYFNPGSVGLAYSHQQPEDDSRLDGWAEYAILTAEDARLALEFQRIPFDVAQLIEVYRTSGRPHGEEAAVHYQPRG